MDLIKEALSMGFANAAIMDTKDLVFVPVLFLMLFIMPIIIWGRHVHLPAAL